MFGVQHHMHLTHAEQIAFAHPKAKPVLGPLGSPSMPLGWPHLTQVLHEVKTATIAALEESRSNTYSSTQVADAIIKSGHGTSERTRILRKEAKVFRAWHGKSRAEFMEVHAAHMQQDLSFRYA